MGNIGNCPPLLANFQHKIAKGSHKIMMSLWPSTNYFAVGTPNWTVSTFLWPNFFFLCGFWTRTFLSLAHGFFYLLQYQIFVPFRDYCKYLLFFHLHGFSFVDALIRFLYSQLAKWACHYPHTTCAHTSLYIMKYWNFWNKVL